MTNVSSLSFVDYAKFCRIKLWIILVIKENTIKIFWLLTKVILKQTNTFSGKHSLDNLPWDTVRLKKLSQRSALRNCLIKVIFSRGEAKDTALLSSRDGYILELTVLKSPALAGRFFIISATWGVPPLTSWRSHNQKPVPPQNFWPNRDPEMYLRI